MIIDNCDDEKVTNWYKTFCHIWLFSIRNIDYEGASSASLLIQIADIGSSQIPTPLRTTTQIVTQNRRASL